MRQIRFDQPEKSVVAKLCINTGHKIDFSNVSLFDRASGYMECLVKEAIQIRLNQKNFNRNNGFTLSQAWNPVTKLFKHDIDSGKAAIEPAHRPVALTDWARYKFGWNVFPNHNETITLRTRTGMVLEMLVFSPLNNLTRLIARDNFIVDEKG
jgi:hypothetical protein